MLGWVGLDRRSLADPRVLLALVLVSVFLLQSWNTGRTQPQGDYWNVWAIGRLTATTSDIYAADSQVTLGKVLEQQLNASDPTPRERQAASYWLANINANNTPALYAVLGVLQTGDFEFDSGVFLLISLLSILIAVACLCRRLDYPPGGALLVMAVLLGANSAMYLDLWVGNFNSIQVGLIVAYVALHAGRRRDLLAGALLGFAIALKPNLVLLAVVVMFALVIQRRWRGFVVHGTGLAIGGVAGLGAGVARFGSLDPWFAWLGTWRDTGFRDYWKMEWGNFSIVRFLWEETGFDASLAVLTAGLAATVVVLLLDARRRPRFADARDAEDRRIARELLLVGIAVAITLLASPLTHQHYYLLLTPLIIFLVRPVGWRFGGATDPRVRLAVSVIAMVLISVWLVQGLGLQGYTLSVGYLLSYVVATALLLAASLREISLDFTPNGGLVNGAWGRAT